MKNSDRSKIESAINRQAHMLAALSFPSIRSTLEQMARDMITHGAGLDEVLAAVRCAGVAAESSDP